jgi:hypothetical protein
MSGCQGFEPRQTRLALGPAHLLGLQLGAQVGHRNGRQGDDIYGSARTQVDRQVGHRFVIRSLDDGDEITVTEHRILRHHLAAEVGYLLVDLFESVRILVQCLASLVGGNFKLGHYPKSASNSLVLS